MSAEVILVNNFEDVFFEYLRYINEYAVPALHGGTIYTKSWFDEHPVFLRSRKKKDYCYYDNYYTNKIWQGCCLLENSIKYLDKEYGMQYNWFFDVLLPFVKFVRTAEKVVMYYNDPKNALYVEHDEKEKTYNVKFDHFNNYHINIQFTETQVPDINPKIGQISGILGDIVNNGSMVDKKTVNIVRISIIRDYGKGMCSTFKFVEGGRPTFENDSDLRLFRKMVHDVTGTLLKEWHKILNKVMEQHSNETDWEEVLTDGLWIS